VDRVVSQDQVAQELVETLVKRETDLVDQVREILEAHQERRMELRRDLHALFAQFGQFPKTNNVRHLRLVKSDKPDDVDQICI
jgi:endonuclease III-like uncharacterized protein